MATGVRRWDPWARPSSTADGLPARPSIDSPIPLDQVSRFLLWALELELSQPLLMRIRKTHFHHSQMNFPLWNNLVDSVKMEKAEGDFRYMQITGGRISKRSKNRTQQRSWRNALVELGLVREPGKANSCLWKPALLGIIPKLVWASDYSVIRSEHAFEERVSISKLIFVVIGSIDSPGTRERSRKNVSLALAGDGVGFSSFLIGEFQCFDEMVTALGW